ncbi:MAG: efflux RND transporter periplasmic adaptor subunit [Opitutales bacterium]|nr:efflux RND transporter periplasmic adaptor subunit [Opitutales bacterium]
MDFLLRQTFLRLTLAGVGVLLLAACGDRDATTESTSSGSPAARGPWGGGPAMTPFVEVVMAEQGRLPLEQRLNGIVRARNEVVVNPEVSGRIEEVLVDDGDAVNQGDPLVRIHSRTLEEQLRQAQAALRLQEATAAQAEARLRELDAELGLTTQLADRNFVSDLELNRQRAQVDIARAEKSRAQAMVESARSSVAERQWLLDQATVRSPVTGVVGRRMAEPGMRVDANTALFMVGDLTEVRVVVNLSERMAGRMQPGHPVEIFSDHFPDDVIQARLTSISPFLLQGSFSTEGTIRVSNLEGRLRSGMFVDVSIFFGEAEPSTLLPSSTLYEDPRTGRIGVFVATEARALLSNREGGSGDTSPLEFRSVEVLGRGRHTVGVSGVQPGEYVVAIGHDLVSRGRGRVAESVRVREIKWDRLIGMQSLQRDDVVSMFMERHRRLAAAREEGLSPSSSSR